MNIVDSGRGNPKNSHPFGSSHSNMSTTAASNANGAAKTGSAGSTMKCVCNWKRCRNYFNVFGQDHGSIFSGPPLKVKLDADIPEHVALKEAIDRILNVSQDWKTNSNGSSYCRYTICRHHYTEKHLKKFLDAQSEGNMDFSLTTTFTKHGARKYLATADSGDTFTNSSGEVLYLPTPTVPREKIDSVCSALKKKLKGSSGTSKEDPRALVARNQQTEQENIVLRDQIDTMKSQLAYLQDMVMKLQEEHYVGTNSVAESPKSRSNHHSSQRARRSPSVQSGGSGVPHEIELGDSDNETDINTHWNENTIVDEDGDNGDNDDWTDYGDDVEQSDNSGAGHSLYRIQPRRRNSSSVMSVGSALSTKSRAKSVISTAKSLKSLPREIELDEDEDDSDDHASLEEEAFDNRSIASSSRISHGGVSLDDYNGSSRRPGSRRTNNGSQRSRRRESTNSRPQGYNRSSRRNSSVRSTNRSTGNFDDNASIASTRSGKSVTFDANSSQNGSAHGSSHSAGTYQVAQLVVTDPYGEKGTYTGSISHSTGMPHGNGRLEYDKVGRWYEGDWKHGRWTGYGRLSNGDGDFYEGGLKNDHKHGRGVMRFADGRTFVGEYVNGQMIEGKMTYQDGSTYAGSWVDGMRHGRGRCVFADQSIYEGEFREGEFFGYGRMAWSDGGWYEGEWFNGEMHGRGKEVRPDGTLRHEGEWSKGQPIRH